MINMVILKRKIIVNYLKYAIVGIATGFANGLFGSGGGTIAVPSMVLLLGIEDHKAHATAISIILPLTLMSVFFYVSNELFDWGLTFKVIIGGAAGGFVGAKLLNKCPVGVLRKIFGAFLIMAGIRML